MIRSMDAARRGSKEQAEAFDKLGISVQMRTARCAMHKMSLAMQ